MRLWHQDLLPYLRTAQLNGQHRECCALRGLGWGRPHSTVDYVFTYNPARLAIYHRELLKIRRKRGASWVDYRWHDPLFRGDRSTPWSLGVFDMEWYQLHEGLIYPEHDMSYLNECLNNLAGKGAKLYNGYTNLR